MNNEYKNNKRQHSKLQNLLNWSDSFRFSPVVLNNDVNKPWCYIYDIDGCLADNCGNRSPFDWMKVGNDKPIESVVKLLEDSSINNKIIICSGRDEVCKQETINWFKKYIPNSDNFTFMLRRENDYRPDWKIKQEMAQEICKNNYITLWVDDRLQVSRHLRMLGLKVLNTAHNNF